MISYSPKRVLVHEQSRGDSSTAGILNRLSGIPVEYISDSDTRTLGSAALEPGSYTKDTLILMHYPGKFLKPCQGSGADVCCNYYVASYAWNCHFECSYCVLQSYLSSEALIVCTNIEDMLHDLDSTLKQSPEQKFRVGTGELADSLALDHLTHYSRRLVPFFASASNGILELKTKSNQIANLRDLDHRGHTVLSWSMNSRYICQTEEHKTASFEERLAAAVQCAEWGYRLGFHFDPVIYYDDWENGYREAVREIFRAVDPEKIVWISLGAVRFPPHLRGMVHERFPKSIVPWGEFVPGHHGKDRYFRPIREEMYRKLHSWIREQSPSVFVYLCMESHFVWERSLGNTPRDLSSLLDSRVFPSGVGPG